MKSWNVGWNKQCVHFPRKVSIEICRLISSEQSNETRRVEFVEVAKRDEVVVERSLDNEAEKVSRYWSNYVIISAAQ